MKLRLTILVAIAMLFMAFDHHKQAVPQNDLGQMNLKGQVKECVNSITFYENGVITADSDLVTKYTFNRLGFIASQIEYDSMGMKRTFYFTFYSNGKYKERKGRVYKHDYYDWPYTLEDYYDTNGNDIYAEKIDTNEKAVEKSWSKYDAKCNFIEEDDSNSVTGKRYVAKRNTYDTKGNLVKRWGDKYEEGKYEPSLESSYCSAMLYDTNGYEIMEYDTSNGRFTGRQEMENDEWGNCVNSRLYDNKNVLNTIEKIKYDSVGHEIEINYYYKSGVRYWHEVHKYDIHGNEIMHYKEIPDEPKFIFRATYTYDNKDNWIKCIWKRDNEIEDIRTRKLVYY